MNSTVCSLCFYSYNEWNIYEANFCYHLHCNKLQYKQPFFYQLLSLALSPKFKKTHAACHVIEKPEILYPGDFPVLETFPCWSADTGLVIHAK